MAKKKRRPMTNAERVRKHRAERSSKRQVNLTLPARSVAALDKKAKQANQTRSEYIAAQIGPSGHAKKTAAAQSSSPIAADLGPQEQLAVLHVLSQIDGDYLQQIAVDGVSAHKMRRAINRVSKALQAQNPEWVPTAGGSKVKPVKITSNRKKKAAAAPKKKRAAKKRSSKPKGVVETALDAIGLARPETFREFAGAVSVAHEVQDFPKMDKAGKQWKDWRSMPREFMSVRQAKKHIETFKETHCDATVNQRYMSEDKTLMEITAAYTDDRPDHRVVYQARDRGY